MAQSAGELLAACLSATGVDLVWGQAPPGLELPRLVPVHDPALAALLADADGRMSGRAGASVGADGTLRLSSLPGASPAPTRLSSPSELPGAVAAAAAEACGILPGAARVKLDLDLRGPASGAPEPATSGRPGDPPDIGGAGAPIVLAGPGVIRGGALRGLRDLADAGNLGVSNTWGAKGVFRWDSPHHLGTVGLQARDFELGGFAEADLVIAVGVDPAESPAERWAGTPTVEVPPAALGALAASWTGGATRALHRPPLYEILSSVVQPLYRSDAFPMAPGRAVSDLAGAIGESGRLAADPGPAGLWVARAFPTTEPGSVVVPATVAAGFAAAAALSVAVRRSSVAPVAVTTAPLDGATGRVLNLARALHASMVVEAWGAGEDVAQVTGAVVRRAADHAGALATARRASGVSVVGVPVDWGFAEALVQAAGEVVAWGGLGRNPS